MSGKRKDGPNHRSFRTKGQGYASKAGGPGVRKPGRREWMKECLKLLEEMMELDYSIAFREPVDCAKHPDYYTVVSDPIDLSKVNFKFRGNQYNDPDEFATDMRQLFDNYHAYFKDPNSEIFHQLNQLASWFETHYKNIVDKWGFRWIHWHSNSSSQGGSTSVEDSTRGCTPPPSVQAPHMGQASPSVQAHHMSHSPPRSQSSEMYMPLVQQVQAAAAAAAAAAAGGGGSVPQSAYPLMTVSQQAPSAAAAGYSSSPVPFTSGIHAPVFTSTPIYASSHHHPMATYASSTMSGYSTSSPQPTSASQHPTPQHPPQHPPPHPPQHPSQHAPQPPPQHSHNHPPHLSHPSHQAHPSHPTSHAQPSSQPPGQPPGQHSSPHPSPHPSPHHPPHSQHPHPSQHTQMSHPPPHPPPQHHHGPSPHQPPPPPPQQQAHHQQSPHSQPTPHPHQQQQPQPQPHHHQQNAPPLAQPQAQASQGPGIPIPIITEPAPEHRPRQLLGRPMLRREGRQAQLAQLDEPGPLTITVPDKSPMGSMGSQGTSAHTSAESELPPSSSSQSVDQSMQDQLELTIANSLVWFGQTQLNSNRPIVLRETGLSFCVSGEAGIEYPIEIHAEEIIRCVAQLGQNKKHTIFLFILPNCTKRLEEMNPNKFCGCSLIVLFTAALSHSQISLMIHIFHNMSKNSIFGPLFSEIDLDGALLLLSNVRPGFMTSRPVEKLKDIMASRSLDVEMCRTVQDEEMGSTSSTQPSSSSSSSHRLTIPVISSERRSLSLNDAPMVAERSRQPQQTESRPLDLSSANTADNSMWNGAVHSNRNLSRTKFHFKQRSMETRKPTPRLGAASASGAGHLRKAQRQLAVDNGSDEDDVDNNNPLPVTTRALESESEGVTKHEASKQSSLSSSSRGSQCSINNDSTNSNSEQCSQSEDIVLTEVRMSNRCPITQQVMHEPVRNRCCQHVYDKEGVEKLIKLKSGKATCPVQGCSNTKLLTTADLVKDYDLWKQIQTTIDEDY